jgi:uncharacterized membrane protein
MSTLVLGMIAAGTATLAVGLGVGRRRVSAASGAGKLVVLGPVFEATALAMFATEHFLAATALSAIVPRWLPSPMFWTWFVGIALLAAAVSLIAWRCVRWSAALLALLFLIIVATVDLPNLPANLHQRLFWTLTLRETCFAAGAMVLAGSQWPRGRAGAAMQTIGRIAVGCIFVVYAGEHFLFPRFVPGVPLAKLTPAWMPAPAVLAYVVGLTLLVSGIGLLVSRTSRVAAAGAGAVLLLLTAGFYVPILVMEIHAQEALEGVNYVGDTLLFAATALLAGFGARG